ncbi:hypothetical protein F5Y10DRAFT_293142 [Nemania abortiva]|nr:hypothetical protein F5Y10DRAFT_293142 [Nemania abortiva]
MASPFRVELLEEERKRRNEVIAAAEQICTGATQSLEGVFRAGKLQRFCAERMLEDRDIGRYPLASANYQHWLEDKHAWIAIFKTEQGFNWPAPDKLGAPYSLTFLQVLYEETEEEKKKRTEEQERYVAAFPNTMGQGPSHAMVDDSDDDANWDNNVLAPTTWNNNGVMIAVEHSSIDVMHGVWTKLFGDSPWPKGCRPFEIPVPKGMDPEAILAAPEDLEGLMFQLWEAFSPSEPWHIRFFARYRKDPSARFGIRVWLYIDWPATQNVQNISWLRSVYHATLCLFRWYHKLLRGEQIHIIKEMNSVNELEFGQHHSLFKSLKVRETLNAQRKDAANAINGDKTVTRAMHHKQQVDLLAIAYGAVEARMKAATNPDRKLQCLVRVVRDGMKPLPLSLDDRRLAVADAAKTLLADGVRAALDADNTIETRMSVVARFLTQGTEGTWEKVLPLGIRFEVVQDVLRQHVADVEDQPFVTNWVSARLFMRDNNEYPPVSDADVSIN